MKKMIALAAFIALSCCVWSETASAQIDSTHQKMGMKMKKVFAMKDGKMMVMKGDKSKVLDKDITLPNGTQIMKDGKVMMKDGTSAMLKEGEMIDMEGKISAMADHKKK